ncbi:MAG: nuclear transport factor 2 family protein [Ferruginibacter sp.]
MKKSFIIPICAACVMAFTSCQEGAKTETDKVETPAMETPKADPAQVRSDIVALEKAWADALNKKDVNALMALYADDAVTMPPGEPSITGKANIQKKEEADFLSPSTYSSIAFETQDVYGQGDVVTEVGKTMYNDAEGKTLRTGKYMAVFEKRDGKYLCIREMYSNDSK